MRKIGAGMSYVGVGLGGLALGVAVGVVGCYLALAWWFRDMYR